MVKMTYQGPNGWNLNGKTVNRGDVVDLPALAVQQMLTNGHPLVAVDKDGPVAVQTGASDLTATAEAVMAANPQEVKSKEK